MTKLYRICIIIVLAVFGKVGEVQLAKGNNSTSLSKDFFTVPNILVYIRVLLIPVFVYLYIHARTDKEYCTALAVMVIAFLTDFFDGKIARRYNLVTDLGKILDPIADKLCQFAVALCLMFKFEKMIYVAIIIFIKELIMGLMGLVLLDKGGKVFGAKWYGKVCTFIVDCSMAFLFLSPLVYADKVSDAISDTLVYICLAVLIITAVLYTRLFSEKIKEADEYNRNNADK